MTIWSVKRQPAPVELSGQNPLLSVEGLGRRVQNRWIWRQVSFELRSGERLAVVGPSGAGKSLLLRAASGLDPVQEGRIVFAGQPKELWFMPNYRTQIVYLHQRPALLEGTVEENIRHVYRLAVHRDRVYDRNRILSYLEVLGRKPDFLERPSWGLSGGESQIVAFLRALQLSPYVLLLDEPTASLDAETAHRIESLVEVWQAEDTNRAYLWTSHDPEQLKRVTDRHITLTGQG